MALADAAGGCCRVHPPPGGRGRYGDDRVEDEHAAAVRSGTIRASAAVLHAGSSTIVVETEIHDDQDRLVAKTTQTQAVLRPS